MGKKNILLLEEDEMTRLLLAKEVEQTSNTPVVARNFNEAVEAVNRKNISMIICDNDIFDGTLFAENLTKFGFDIPVITTSTFLNNQKLITENSIICCLKKPVDYEGYKKLREHITSLKKIS